MTTDTNPTAARERDAFDLPCDTFCLDPLWCIHRCLCKRAEASCSEDGVNDMSTTETTGRRPYPGDDTFCTGFDVPDRDSWGPEEIAFWTGTPTYQPWKDVAAYFQETMK